jgi:hypothetical protein
MPLSMIILTVNAIQGGNANWSNWSRADVTNRSLAIQAVLSEKFNYAIELEGHGCCSVAQNRTIALANAHPERTLDGEVHTVYLWRISQGGLCV